MLKQTRRILHTFTLTIVTGVLLSASVGLLAPAPTKAAGCNSPSIGFGRWEFCGYWYNKFQSTGEDVRMGGIPASVNTANQLIALLEGDLVSGNNNHRTGAMLVMRTMLGAPTDPLPTPPQPVGSAKTVSSIPNWESLVRGYANISEGGFLSTGTSGQIEWNVWEHLPCGTINTMWQPAYDDVTPYHETLSNSTCGNASAFDQYIVFRNPDGSVAYRLRRLCMNPVGQMGQLNRSNYDVQPSVSTGGVTQAEQGDSITFTYTAHNAGSTVSSSTNCNIYANVYSGQHAAPSPADSGSNSTYSGSPPACPFTVNAGGNQTIATETVTASSGNQTICRSLYVTPAKPDGSNASAEACVPVVTKPYARVFGGDVMVGSGLGTASNPDTCTPDNSASAVGWNKRAGGSFAGAGTQYATYALGAINDFATAQGSTGAPAGTGLSFANTSTNPGIGLYGGSFGTVNCIPDYYSTKPGTTSSLPASVSAMSTGAYSATGQISLSGGSIINPGEQIQVYIDGDLFVTSNIVYAGSWRADKIPLIQFVVRGNIYISNAVTQLDGVYIAQDDGTGNKGIIYTCTNPASPFTPLALDGNLYATCNSKLTINGSFVARSLRLLRTSGSLNQSSSGENVSGSNGGEVFNYNPTLWIAQPLPTSANTKHYDSITSLPPIL